MLVIDWICYFDNEFILFKLMFVGKIFKVLMFKELLYLIFGRLFKFWN